MSRLRRRKIGGALSTAALLLAVVWLLRGPMLLAQYGDQIILGVLILYLAANLVSIETRFGVGWAFASLIGRLARFLFISGIMLWLLSFFGLSDPFRMLILPFIIAGLLMGMASMAASSLVGRPKMLDLRKTPFYFEPGTIYSDERVTVLLPDGGYGFKVRRYGAETAAILFSSVVAEIETEAGKFNITFRPPVMVRGRDFSKVGRRVSKDEFGESGFSYAKALGEASRLLTREVSRRRIVGGYDLVKLPFVHIESSEYEDVVEVGPLRIVSGIDGDYVEFGPFFKVGSYEASRRKRPFSVVGYGEPKAELTVKPYRVTASWDGIDLEIRNGQIKIVVGESSAEVSSDRVRLSSPAYSIEIGESGMLLTMPDLRLVVKGDSISLAFRGRVKKVRDPELASRLLRELGEVTKNQVLQLFEGFPPDPFEILERIEDLLGE